MMRIKFLFAKPVSINVANVLPTMVPLTAARPVGGSESRIIQQMIVNVLKKVILNQVPSANTARLAIHRANLAADHHPKIVFHAMRIVPP
jgi:hypothetical protein